MPTKLKIKIKDNLELRAEIDNLMDKEKMIAWQPYEADVTDDIIRNEELTIEAVLTRRNTFGPLHQLPVRALAYGPFSFVTEGAEFSKAYELIPSGLLKEPTIKILAVS